MPHGDILELTNLKITFFSPNTNLKLHRLDQGIIQNLKINYRWEDVHKFIMTWNARPQEKTIHLMPCDGYKGNVTTLQKQQFQIVLRRLAPM